MIEINDIWQAVLLVLACKLGWDLYILAKAIVIDYYRHKRTE